jgi:hypothetical protein
VIPCDSEYSLIFCNSGIQIYQGIRKVFMVICAICMCANGTIVTDINIKDVASPTMINTLTLISGFGLLIYSGRRGLVYYLSM